MSESDGQRCGEYDLIELVGSGSSGKVYRAADRSGTQLAVKLLDHPPGSAIVDKLRSLQHKNLCRVLEQGEDPELGSYLVTQFVPGQNLEEARREFPSGKVPLRRALGWIRDALKGLLVLHNRGLLHADLKPSNLMLSEEGHVVVCDLTAVLPLQGPLEADLRSGTPEYLPPGDKHLRTPKRDLYALGITLTGLLVGRLPELDEEIVPSLMDPLLGSAVDDLVEQALDLQGGFRSAVDMLNAVEVLLGESTSPPSLGSLSPPTRRVELRQGRLKTALWPWLVVLLMLPLGVAARSALSPSSEIQQSTTLWSGVAQRPIVHQRSEVWQTTILGRPVTAFLGPDEINSEPDAHSRALWCAAVLEEAHFRKEKMRFEYRNERPDSCEAWLGQGEAARFLFRVTPEEAEHYDRPAPLLARYWCALIEDTTALARPGSRGSESGASALLLKPWTRRFETLSAHRTEIDQKERVQFLVEALYTLEDDLREEILESCLKPPKAEESK